MTKSWQKFMRKQGGHKCSDGCDVLSNFTVNQYSSTPILHHPYGVSISIDTSMLYGSMHQSPIEKIVSDSEVGWRVVWENSLSCPTCLDRGAYFKEVRIGDCYESILTICECGNE